MLREYFKLWNKFEISLVAVGTIVIILVDFIFQSEILAIICSILNVVTAMLQAKGKVESRFVAILGCITYSYISYKNMYYGEVIFYIIIMLPMSICGIISWLLHKDEKTNLVEVNKVSLNEWKIILVGSIVLFCLFYNILKFLNTSELLISTFYMIVSLLSIYLLVRRSKYSFVFYIINDIILIILWILPIISGNLIFVPMVIDPLILLLNDSYAIKNWNEFEKFQK